MKDTGIKAVRRMVDQAGLQLLDLRLTGGQHIRCRVRAPDGREENHYFPGTPGDARSNKNALACLRRFARGISTKIERTH